MLNDQPPVAICELSQTQVRPIHESIDFLGDKSYDPNGYDILEYQWNLVERPQGASNDFSRGAASYDNMYGFVPDMAGQYVAELKVMNDRCVVSDPCQVTFDARPNENLWVEMFWSRPGDDMDLHLIRNHGYPESSDDCYYGNCIDDEWHDLEWGSPATAADDPFLDLDDIENVGPENINIEAPANGVYTVTVHDFPGSVVQGSNDVTVRIYLNGEMLYNETKAISGEDSFTDFAMIRWPQASVEAL